MPPRYLERIQRQSGLLRDAFGDPPNPPPPYSFSPTTASTSQSSFYDQRSDDSSAYQNRLSQGSQTTCSQGSSSSMAFRPGYLESVYDFPPPPAYSLAPSPTYESPFSAVLPPNSLVLVTGANGYQALHITSQLLTHGFRVRGVVRTAETAVSTAKLFLDRFGAGRYTTAVIPDMAVPGAYDLAVRTCSGVVHCASVTTPSANPHEVITPSIAGAINALQSAAKEPSMRRFVLTSCVSAAVSHERMMREVVGAESWNMLDFELAWAPPPYDDGDDERVLAVAASAKMQAELAVWRWCREKRPGFVVNSVVPDMLFGAPLDEGTAESGRMPVSARLLANLLDGKPVCPPPGHFAHVADSATLHLAALLLPDVQNERVFAVAGPWNLSGLMQILRKLYPERMAESSEAGAWTRVRDERVDWTVFEDARRAEELLRRVGGRGWIGLEESVREGCARLV